MRIIATGSATPSELLDNTQLSAMVDTSDQWIRSRTGIACRRIATSETTLSLATEAARRAMALGAVAPENIKVVICATISHESRCPSLACLLQRELGLANDILAFDLNAACSGFIYAMICASKLVEQNGYALIVGSEVLSRLTDYNDRNTCVLFGDAAGAAVIAASDQPCFWVSETEGDDTALYISDHIHMDGKAVFKFAVEALVRTIRSICTKAGLLLTDIPLFICHQANKRIITSTARQLGLPLERFFINLEQYGNTSAASIPLALDEAARAGLLQPGAPLVLAGFGGGLSAGAFCLRWQDQK